MLAVISTAKRRLGYKEELLLLVDCSSFLAMFSLECRARWSEALETGSNSLDEVLFVTLSYEKDLARSTAGVPKQHAL